jgi:hypothetical protein
MRHFLPGAVGRLTRRVVPPAGGGCLMATPCPPHGKTAADVTACLAAVLLAVVAAPADVEHPCATATSARPKAVVKDLRGA